MDLYTTGTDDMMKVVIQSERKESTYKVESTMDNSSTLLQLTWITTSWEHLAEMDVLDALMPDAHLLTCAVAMVASPASGQ